MSAEIIVSAAVETWSAHLERLAPLSLTPEQLEVIRRAGGARRHRARIDGAMEELLAIFRAVSLPGVSTAPARRLICAAIKAAIAQIGEPGSRTGTAPPGWYPGHTHVEVRIAAMLTAIGEVRREAPEEEAYATMDGRAVVIIANGRQAARISPREMPTLAEHVLAVSVATRAKELDRWLISGIGEPPPPPDAAACEALERLCVARTPEAQAKQREAREALERFVRENMASDAHDLDRRGVGHIIRAAIEKATGEPGKISMVTCDAWQTAAETLPEAPVLASDFR